MRSNSPCQKLAMAKMHFNAVFYTLRFSDSLLLLRYARLEFFVSVRKIIDILNNGIDK